MASSPKWGVRLKPRKSQLPPFPGNSTGEIMEAVVGPGYCLVDKIPHPPGGGWVGIGMGGWVGPKFQHFGPPGNPPPPPGGAGALFGGFGFVQGSEIGLIFSLFFS